MKKLVLAFLFLFTPPLFAANPKPEANPIVPSFLQIDKDGSLQTSIVTYEKGDTTVDLIGAIHVGDKDYYKQLNRQMTQYDALLYELVAPKGVIPERNSRLMSSILKMSLDLDSQTARIDYSKKNFVHADLSFDEMKEAMEQRGEDLLIVGLKILSENLQQKNIAKKKLKQNPLEAIELAAITLELQNAKTTTETKRALAKLLTKQIGNQGPTLNTLLIKDRNIKAIHVLNDQMKNHKKIGIFYGAAHMEDFDRRLQHMGFKPKNIQWITAWDLNDE